MEKEQFMASLDSLIQEAPDVREEPLASSDGKSYGFAHNSGHNESVLSQYDAKGRLSLERGRDLLCNDGKTLRNREGIESVIGSFIRAIKEVFQSRQV